MFLLSIDIRQVIDLVKDPKGPKVTRPDMKVLSDPSLPVEVPDYVKGKHRSTLHSASLVFST